MSSSHAQAVLVLDDGKILATSHADITGLAPSDNSFALARHDSAGNLDPTFDADGKVETHVAAGPPAFERVQQIAAQPDGKIVVAGTPIDRPVVPTWTLPSRATGV